MTVYVSVMNERSGQQQMFCDKEFIIAVTFGEHTGKTTKYTLLVLSLPNTDCLKIVPQKVYTAGCDVRSLLLIKFN